MAAIFPVTSAFAAGNLATTDSYSGKFIPAVWSAKLNAKFYKASIYGEIANTDWQGEVASMGDKVYINTAPTITVSAYSAGTSLSYQVPTPDMQELLIDKGFYFAFQINDVLEYQAKPNLMDMFAADAAEQMRTKIDSTVIYNTFSLAAGANKGLTAGAQSASYNMGTDAAPITLAANNVVQKVLEMASILDEQNVPETDRFLVIDPATRALLFQSELARAYSTGDDTSPVRNGKIGKIDRFDVYVSNNLPKGASGSSTPWTSGDGTETSVTSTGTVAKRKAIIAGQKSALTFASQITKMETVRNPNDFGDFIRSLNVFGYKVVKPEAMALMIAA
jgi:hypothetical protein